MLVSRACRAVLAALLLAVLLAPGCQAPPGHGGATPRDESAREPGAAWAEATADTERVSGLLAVHRDRARNRLLVELPPPGDDGVCAELVFVAALSRGLGSNDVGLDRGLLGDEQLLRIRRLGKLVRFEVPNLRYVVAADDSASRRAAEESFAGSVLWGAEVAALHADGRALVDLTPWLLTDLVGAARQLEARGQGGFTLDAARSHVELDDCLVFPGNLELEATLGFTGERPGAEVRATAPEPRHPSLRQHVTLMALPAPGYTARPHDPRAGAFALERVRLDAPLAAPMVERVAIRHRLRRGADGRPEPLVYHVDRAAPEPVRTALLEGARWWAEAFAAAGWPDTFRVELLPEHVHPLDSRYHVIQWVHRRNRGWSYGRSVIDPRTGEILKAHVTLGALRVRQDVLLFEGLLGAAGATGVGASDAGSGEPRDGGDEPAGVAAERGGQGPVALALARLRQLSAHEVGHTLGLAHNFAASTWGDRASVMDYPVPRVGLGDDERFDLSDAYGVGVGAWDRFAVRHLYGEAPPGTSLAAARAAWLDAALADGALYLSDADARPAGAADPRAALWDDGADAVEHLRHALRVRELALQRFDLDRVDPSRPLAHLQEVLVPLALHHRYALDRVVKCVGGRHAEHRLAGEVAAARAARDADASTPAGTRGGAPGSDALARAADPVRDVPADTQRAALRAALSVLDPAVLGLPEHVRALLVPRPPGEEPHRELFPTGMAPHADPLAVAAVIADQAVRGLLVPERLARVAEQHARDAAQLGLPELLDALVAAGLARYDAEPHAPTRALRRVALEQVLLGLLDLLDARDVDRFVRAQAETRLTTLAGTLDELADRDDLPGGSAHAAHARALAADIRRELERPRAERPAPPRAPDAPPGSPIGGW